MKRNIASPWARPKKIVMSWNPERIYSVVLLVAKTEVPVITRQEDIMRNQSFPLGAFQLAGLCFLLLISSVAAANQFSTTAYGQAATYTQVVDSGPNNGLYFATADAQAMQFGFAHGHADASIGSLTVFGYADASCCGNASAKGLAQFFDTLTVTGSGMANFTFGFSTDPHCQPGPGGSVALNASLNAGGQTLSSISCGGTVQSVVVSASAGQTINLYGSLFMVVVTPVGTVSSGSDPFQVFINPLTPGDGYISASGIVYPTAPVPEPSSLLLGGPGMVSLLWLVRRKLL